MSGQYSFNRDIAKCQLESVAHNKYSCRNVSCYRIAMCPKKLKLPMTWCGCALSEYSPTQCEKNRTLQHIVASRQHRTVAAHRPFWRQPVQRRRETPLSEIIETFNQRHSTNFTEDDILRMEQINDALLADENTVEMLRNNPPDVAINAFAEDFLQGPIRMFQRD